MKRFIIIVLALICSCGAIFASVDGRTTVGVNYGYDDGNMFGLTTDTVGYINDGVVGYYIGVDADFYFNNIDTFRIGMQVGPSYSYDFENTNMSVEIAGGLSASYKTVDMFSFGVGGYLGAAWHFATNYDLILGVKLGSDFVNISLDNGHTSVSGDFYVLPSLSFGFKY